MGNTEDGSWVSWWWVFAPSSPTDSTVTRSHSTVMTPCSNITLDSDLLLNKATVTICVSGLISNNMLLDYYVTTTTINCLVFLCNCVTNIQCNISVMLQYYSITVLLV